MINRLILALVRGLLKLRYRVRVKGLDEVAARGQAGILFLPNHPALIDPVILMTQLYPQFRPRPLADQDQVNRPGVRWFAGQINVVTIPDPAVYGDASRKAVAEGVEKCIEALKSGSNLLLYPAGHIAHQRSEDLAGASAVETILQRLPEVRVILVRTRGLWGSSFSRAYGMAPAVGKVMKKALRSLLANGVFFSPRRTVDIEVSEPADFPRTDGRAVINRYLEGVYNQDPPSAWYVPYTRWEKDAAHEMPEPASQVSQADIDDVPAATRDLVIGHLQKLTGRASIQVGDSLSRDLNLDSLSIVDLGLWVESEFGFAVGDSAAIQTVGDLFLAARGHVAAHGKVELKPVPKVWFPVGGSPITPRPGRRGVSLPEGTTLASVFLAQAALGPDRVVLADQISGVKTYRDIITGILALKPQIERIPGKYVGIMLPASAGAGVLYLATLFSGKVPVMVNWTVGVRNMTHSLDLLGVTAVLTSGRLVRKIESQSGSLGELKSRFIMLEQLGTKIGNGDKLRAWLVARFGWRSKLAAIQVQDTAVVLFTSGSESTPKAVPLTHANLLANMRDLCQIFQFSSDDRLIGILPPFHSFGLSCTMLLPLCSGIPVAYHPNPTEGAILVRLIEAYRITLLVGTPTFLNGILRAVASSPLKGEDRGEGGDVLRSLRAVISGAEKCPEQTYDLVKRRWPHMKLIEGYGITECSPVVAANDENDPKPGTIGRVLPSVDYAIQDMETGRFAQGGTTGLLLVRGASIFGGYLNYEGPSPFVEFDGKQWYRTGDLVRQQEDGTLIFSGRLKRFVKLGGEMVSLPAIEEVLVRHYGTPADEKPILAVEASPVELNPELVLFTIRDLDREDVNNRIKEAGLSPIHNIRTIRKVDEIPVLGTGKTDYRALKSLL
ncbi:MAG: AMP-binding protein [bacterium]